MGYTSNVLQVQDEINKLIEDCVDLRRPGIEGSLGRDILANQAARISERASREEGTDGKWAANRGRYAKRKGDEGLPVGVGIPDKSSKGNPMLSFLELQGEKEITADEAIMSIGTSEDVQKKAQWFTNGSIGSQGEPSGAKNQPPREFYGITDQDADDIRDEIADSIERFLRES